MLLDLSEKTIKKLLEGAIFACSVDVGADWRSEDELEILDAAEELFEQVDFENILEDAKIKTAEAGTTIYDNPDRVRRIKKMLK